jgi:hypothetical protein
MSQTVPAAPVIRDKCLPCIRQGEHGSVPDRSYCTTDNKTTRAQLRGSLRIKGETAAHLLWCTAAFFRNTLKSKCSAMAGGAGGRTSHRRLFRVPAKHSLPMAFQNFNLWQLLHYREPAGSVWKVPVKAQLETILLWFPQRSRRQLSSGQ